MTHTLPCTHRLLPAGHPVLMPVSKRCLKNRRGQGGCVEVAT
ncbi:MAG: hypothetical protein ACLGGY_03930 [Gammaproteobacteria bacterium]